jgi:hypothetical protein
MPTETQATSSAADLKQDAMITTSVTPLPVASLNSFAAIAEVKEASETPSPLNLEVGSQICTDVHRAVLKVVSGSGRVFKASMNDRREKTMFHVSVHENELEATNRTRRKAWMDATLCTRTWRRLRPQIVDSVWCDNSLNISTLVEGQQLTSSQGTLTRSQVIDTSLKILEEISKLWELGVGHGALSLENVLKTKKGLWLTGLTSINETCLKDDLTAIWDISESLLKRQDDSDKMEIFAELRKATMENMGGKAMIDTCRVAHLRCSDEGISYDLCVYNFYGT